MLKSVKSYELEIEAAALMLQALEAIKKTAKKFDGKQFNKKFNDALPEIDDVYSYIRKNDFSGKFEIEVRVRKYTDVGNYVEYPKVFAQWDVRNIFEEGSKKIDAERIAQLVNDEIDKIKKYRDEIAANASPEAMQALEAERDRLKEEIRKFNRSLDGVSYCLFRINEH